MGERCTVEGTVQSVVFQNEENGYTVLSLLTELGEIVTVVECIPYAAPGEGMTVTGVWVTHPLYGPQITCEQAERRLPRDEEEMVSYLASGILKGVGQATAERLVAAFGTDTLRVLEEEPEKLSRIKGITAKKAVELGFADEVLYEGNLDVGTQRDWRLGWYTVTDRADHVTYDRNMLSIIEEEIP